MKLKHQIAQTEAWLRDFGAPALIVQFHRLHDFYKARDCAGMEKVPENINLPLCVVLLGVAADRVEANRLEAAMADAGEAGDVDLL